MGEPADQEIVRKARAEDIPRALDYLEAELPGAGYLFGDIGIADIALAAFFRNAALARFSIDAARWPLTAGFIARVLDHPAFVALRPFEDLSMRTPIAEQRAALLGMGAPLTTQSYAGSSPRRGVMSV